MLLASSMSAMERCPLELWEKIFALACTDGGFTGCSLSLVSRRVRALVEPFRYHSISLVEYEKFLAFASLLKGFPMPPTICHLFISVKLPDIAPYTSDHAGRAPFIKELFEEAFLSILTIVASELRSLCVHSPAVSHILALAFKLPFPLLTYLMVPCPLNGFCLKDIGRRLVALERLHVIRCFAVTPLCDSLPQFAPSVTHVGFSDMSSDLYAPQFLKHLLKVDVQLRPGRFRTSSHGVEDKVANIIRSLPLLKAVYVQPQKLEIGPGLPSSDACGPLLNKQMNDELEQVAKAHADGATSGIKLHLFPRSTEYSMDDARRDWLGVVNSGDGAKFSAMSSRELPLAVAGAWDGIQK